VQCLGTGKPECTVSVFIPCVKLLLYKPAEGEVVAVDIVAVDIVAVDIVAVDIVVVDIVVVDIVVVHIVVGAEEETVPVDKAAVPQECNRHHETAVPSDRECLNNKVVGYPD
jgi:hypothetical protein